MKQKINIAAYNLYEQLSMMQTRLYMAVTRFHGVVVLDRKINDEVLL